MKCQLCEALKKEVPLAENKDFVILRTKKLKGHKERIMVVLRVHASKMLRPTELEAEEFLETVGKKLFKYTAIFVIMEPDFATIKDHWHLVCSDLDPNSEDYEQILATKWRKVVSVCEENE